MSQGVIALAEYQMKWKDPKYPIGKTRLETVRTFVEEEEDVYLGFFSRVDSPSPSPSPFPFTFSLSFGIFSDMYFIYLLFACRLESLFLQESCQCALSKW